MFSNEKLLKLNEQGLIPGPGEEKEAFLKRVALCDSFIPEGASNDPSAVIEEALDSSMNLFGIKPSWVHIIFSDKKLPPWHGACAWIVKKEKSGPRTAFLQLRKIFEKKKHLLRLYSRKEVVAHELAHIGRMAFNEPKFEEILAYRTSSPFRQFLGPIIQSSKEAILFIFSIMAALFADMAVLPLTWLKLLPVGLVVLAFGRLWKRQQQFKRCLQTVSQDKEKANAIIYRMTDEEIIKFSKSSREAFVSYSKTQNSLRWQVIKTYQV